MLGNHLFASVLRADTEGARAHIRFNPHREGSWSRGTLGAAEGRSGSPGSLLLGRTHQDRQPLSLEPRYLVYQAARSCALWSS